MNRRILLLAIAGLFTINCFSQTENGNVTNVTKATIISPGLSYELRVGQFQTLYAQAFMAPSFGISWSDALGTNSFFYLDPAVTLQYRYYYNYRIRSENGKRTAMNSLNYIAPVYEAVFSKQRVSSSQIIETERRTINRLGIVWGFQRNYASRFSLDFYAGPAYLFTKGTVQTGNDTYTETVSQLSAIIQINLGFWLNKRK